MNTAPPFDLDSRLEHDTWLICDLHLCRVLLMDDSRYPWVILVPRLQGIVEITDLDEQQRASLWGESLQVCQLLKQRYPQGKLNIGALGNVVSQFHLHHVVRHQGDPAWPGPVWGHSPAVAYSGGRAAVIVNEFAGLLQG